MFRRCFTRWPSLEVIATLGAIGLTSLAGCQPPETVDRPADADTPLHIAVIPKGTTHVFWQSVRVGAERAAAESNARITFRGPAKENDRDEQINIVQGFLNAQVDGICLAPLDADALVRPVEEAGRGGVPVVIFDSGLNVTPSDGDVRSFVSYVATDNFRGGQLAGDAMADALGEDGGNVILLRYSKGSESTYQREEGFLAALAEREKIKILSSDQYAGTTTESAVDKAQAILNRYGDDVDGIFAVCEPNAEGVLRALKDRGLAGQVAFVAFDSSESLREALAEDAVTAIVLQDPVRMGYLSVKTITSHLRGETVEPLVDTGVVVATKANLAEDEIQRLLDPPRQ